MNRSSSHRALQYGRSAALGCVVLLLLVAGVLSSWDSAQHIVLAKGREHGTLTVTGCGDDVCTGPFAASEDAQPRARVSVDKSVAARKGDRFPVVVKPGTAEVVRTGTPGFLHAWVPLGGALLLAALVIGGGLRLTRTAWFTGIAGGVLLVAAFVAL
ncbi:MULTISPECIES: hypothetical protein [unclassified Streptomyces]|uniref:hypothetical protein n=1 Tax=unclassified Streptomyces TaxID=2593676 RepID=UPI00225147C4|nr:MULTISPECIES: hypothetical protein [unclassified Streptomyces]MCX5140792.1 hypothetical protein [Streptomyces sp. NBC_00338]WRZ65315.1 hypothetical protein OG408_16115 [Streptomyces sp. NBC_01257]WSU59315.1 hypothetical protein OG450_16300 [Streptomyces sp. NBC_01104]